MNDDDEIVGRRRIGLAAVFVAACLVGPWFREFGYAAAAFAVGVSLARLVARPRRAALAPLALAVVIDERSVFENEVIGL